MFDERELAGGVEAIDAAVDVSSEDQFPIDGEKVIDVLFLGTPQSLDSVVGVDLIDGGTFDAGDIDHSRGGLGLDGGQRAEA